MCHYAYIMTSAKEEMLSHILVDCFVCLLLQLLKKLWIVFKKFVEGYALGQGTVN